MFAWAAPQAAAGPYPGAPDPGGNPDLPVQVPPPAGKYFGFQEAMPELDTHGWSAADIAEVTAGAGANLHRFNLEWWNVETVRDVWHEAGWLRYQRLYDALVARGITPLITVAGTPEWAVDVPYRGCGHRIGCEYPPAVFMNAEWAEFNAELASRFPQAVLEIWNEPNLQGFYKPFPDPWRYAELVTIAYDAIKGVNPSIPVLAGGLAPTQDPQFDLGGNHTHAPLKWFLNNAYGASPSLKNHMDGISFHTTFQQLNYGAESLYAKAFQDVRSVSSNHGDSGIDIWISETGLTTQGNEEGTLPEYSEFEQAVGLMLQYRRLMQMSDVRGMVIHMLGDRVELAPNDFNRGYGTVRSWTPFVPKLSYCAFAGRVDTPDPYGPCDPVDEDPPDMTPPQTTITGGPSGTVASGNASFTYSSSEPGSTFQCKLDTGGWSACPASGKAYSGLGDGSHTFSVRATDTAGNTDGSPAGRSWTVDTTVPDTTPPQTAITGGPSGTVTNGNPFFTYSSSEPGSTFGCKLDAGAWSSCPASGKAYSGLGDGSHTFSVRATDAAGNTDGSPASRTWTVNTSAPDTVAPNTSILQGPTGTVSKRTASFEYASTESGSTFKCKLDSGGWASCPASGKSYNGLADGAHTFRVRARDGAGNVDTSPATRTWTIDREGGGDPSNLHCSTRMIFFRWSIRETTGKQRHEYLRSYKRTARRCVPAYRRADRLTARIKKSRDPAVKSALRAERRRVFRRCGRCRRGLRRLEVLAAGAEDDAEFESYLQQHDAARRACDGKR